MTIRTLSKISFFLSVFIYSNLFAQGFNSSDKEFELELRNFVRENLVEFGSDVINQERFLVEQMRLINFEIQSRFQNLKQKRAEYFAGLQNRLIEIEALKSRLSSGGSQNLMAFIDQLETRIKQTIDEGRINYRRQKVFEDGLQLLYIAEEMGNLDTGAQISGDPAIREQLMSSQQKLSTGYGEKENFMERVSSASGATIFDLFRQWKLTNTLEYEARWTDVQIIKNKLLRDGTGLDKQRMFRQELQAALLAYNYRNFDLAERMFSELITRYDFISTMDDLYYYQGMADVQLGRYELARAVFLEQVKKYPTSSFTANAYTQLIKIASHLKDHNAVTAYYDSYKKYATAMDPSSDENRFQAAESFIQIGRYEDAVNELSQIQKGSEFYIDAQYLLSRAYIGAENIDESIRVLQGILSDYNLAPEFHFLIKMKLGYLMFEKGNYYQAIRFFDEINSDFSMYDRVLIGYGWTYYKLELQKPEEEGRDFSYAKKYVQIVLDDYYASDYVLEAKSLLGYILQLEEDADNAINTFDDVFRARTTKEKSDENLAERERLRAQLRQVVEDRDKALAAYDQNAFIIAHSRYSTIQDSLLKLSYGDMSATSGAAYSEIRKIQDQIAELERLKGVAARKNDPGMVAQIEVMQEQLRDVITDNIPANPDPRLGVNEFDEFPIARKESVRQSQSQKVLAMRNEIAGQREYIQSKLDEISAGIARARSRRNYKSLVELEVQQEKFQNLLKKFDQLNTYTYDLAMGESNVDFQKWTDYGAFGVADVNYSLKQSKLKKRSYYIDQINKINQILNGRKELLEYKINLIEGEINYMTRKVRQQERMRERAELDRKFEESYFDTHTSEVPETEEAPPVINEQENQNP